MTSLHEVIAAEGDRNETATKLVSEAIVTFTKKADHFVGRVKKLTMYDEARSSENTVDHKEVVTTVAAKLDHVWDALGEAIDCTATKENSNTSPEARADVIVGADTVLKDVPVTVLLNLERRLAGIRDMYNKIPTLDPSVSWVPDQAAGANHYKSEHPVEQHRTEKTLDHKVLYEATEHHPAQIESFTIDRNVGKISTEMHSGMVKPATKARWLSRISALQIAVKEARQRANQAEIVEMKIATPLARFIHT